MPLYEYECQSCGEHVEKIQRVDDAPLLECPRCGGELRRLLGVPALQFKGSGWYVTDYGRGNGRGASSDTSTSGDGGSAPTSGESAKDSKTSATAPAAGSSTAND